MNKNIESIKISKVVICLLTLCFSFLSFSCISAPKMEKIPAWINYPGDVYPEEEYLYYVGYGADRNSAEISALNGISAIFEQHIQSSTAFSTRMTQAKNKGIVATVETSGFNQNIIKNVNVENLTGVEIKDYWFSSSEYNWYAIAVLNKNQAASLYKSMIIKNAEIIRAIVDGTKNDLYSIQSYCAYDFAQEIALENKRNLDRLYVVDYKVAETMKNYVIVPADLAEKKMKIAGKIPIAVIIDGDSDGKIASAFLDAFKEQGFIGSLDNRVRYIVTGQINYDREDTRDGRTTKCNYSLESFLYDTKNETQLFPVNIRGRQSHTTYDKAKNRAESELINYVLSEFSKSFNSYLSGYSEK